MSLWGRKVAVLVGEPGQTGISISGLRIGFAVRHDLTKNPSTATINIYNPTPETVAYFEHRAATAVVRNEEGNDEIVTLSQDSLVRLSAGYGVPRQIFQGNPILDGVRMAASGGDRILTVEAKDGLRAYQDTQIDISFATSTTLSRLFAEVSDQLGLPLAVPVDLDPTISFSTYAYSGPAHVLLDRLSAMSTSAWVIRDGALLLIEDGEPTGEAATLFSSDAGNLVGSPTRRDRGAVELTALLDNSIRPGKAFRVQSQYISGDYIAQVVSFAGDSGFASPFHVKVLGLPR